MSNTGNRGVDEVALKNSISKWNNCTKVINDQIANLDEDERVIYEELYSYWRTSSFNKAYCKDKIESLKPYDKCHKGALLTANQEFRRRATFFYTESESNFKAFHEDMKKLMGAEVVTTPVSTPTPVPTPTLSQREETIDEKVARWRKVVKLINTHGEVLTVVEQTCFEQLANFHRTSTEFDPNSSADLISALITEVDKRSEGDPVISLLVEFIKLCIDFYTVSEDAYFEFQNTVRPRRQPSTVQPVASQQRTASTSQTARPVNSSTSTEPVSNTPKRESTLEPWQDNTFSGLCILYGIFVIYSFWTEGFWGGLWDSFKVGLLAVVLTLLIFSIKSIAKFLITIIVLSSIIAGVILFRSSGGEDDKVDDKAVAPTTVIVSTTTYHSVSQSGLNVRAAANGSARVIGTLLYNQEVEVIKIVNGFAEIKYGAGVGYVSASYIERGQSKAEVATSAAKPVRQTTSAKPQQSTPSQPPTAPKPVAAPKPKPAPAKPKTASQYYTDGVKLAKSFKEAEAKVALKKAIDMGSTDAMYYLGMTYVNGGSNSAEGFNLVLKAANAGHKEATFQVAEMYNSGTGTSKDKTQAKVWYQKAEALGDARATSRLRRL